MGKVKGWMELAKMCLLDLREKYFKNSEKS